MTRGASLRKESSPSAAVESRGRKTKVWEEESRFVSGRGKGMDARRREVRCGGMDVGVDERRAERRARSGMRGGWVRRSACVR